MDLQIFDRMQSEIKGYIRSFPVIFDKASGAELFDHQGGRYVDFFSGAGTLNYGHNNPVLREKLVQYLDSDNTDSDPEVLTKAKEYFQASFNELILKPRNMQYELQFTGPSSSNAVESALKLARTLKGRQNIISFTNGFQGVATGSLAAAANNLQVGVAFGNTSFMPFDGYFGPDVNTMAYLERMLDDPSSGLDQPAAVIVETVQGDAGINVASCHWLRELERLCRVHDMLLIIDDVQVGCGRTGNFFSFESIGIEPDIITLSKSLSGFGMPMSLILFKPEFMACSTNMQNHVFSGNALAFITAAQSLETYWSDTKLSDEVDNKSCYVRNILENLAHSYGDLGLGVRGRGLVQGLVTPVGDALASRVVQRAFDQGLVIETSGVYDEVIKVLPPLTIRYDLLEQGLEILERSVSEAVV